MAQNSTAPAKPAKLGFAPGCVASTEMYGEEMALRAVFPALGIALETPKGLSCCGAPLRSINLAIPQYLAARNLAVFEKAGLDVLTPCPQCHLAYAETLDLFARRRGDFDQINSMLAEEGLAFSGKVKLYHTLDALHDLVGTAAVKAAAKNAFKGQNVASHYGCHLIRFSQVPRPDHSENPKKMEAILASIGLESKAYPERLNCCGGPLYANLPDSALTKTGQKLQAVKNRKFDALCVSCPWGFRMFDSRQKAAGDTVGDKLEVPVYTLGQLVGMALGLDHKALGLQLSKSPRGVLPENKGGAVNE